MTLLEEELARLYQTMEVKGLKPRWAYEEIDNEGRIGAFRERILGDIKRGDVTIDDIIDRIWRLSEFIDNDDLKGYKKSPRHELKKLKKQIEKEGIQCILKKEV